MSGIENENIRLYSENYDRDGKDGIDNFELLSKNNEPVSSLVVDVRMREHEDVEVKNHEIKKGNEVLFKISVVPDKKSQIISHGGKVEFERPKPVEETSKITCSVSAKKLDRDFVQKLIEKMSETGMCEARCKSVAAAQKLIDSAGPMVVKIKFVFDENSPISKADQDKIQQMLETAKAKFALPGPKAPT